MFLKTICLFLLNKLKVMTMALEHTQLWNFWLLIGRKGNIRTFQQFYSSSHQYGTMGGTWPWRPERLQSNSFCICIRLKRLLFLSFPDPNITSNFFFFYFQRFVLYLLLWGFCSWFCWKQNVSFAKLFLMGVENLS